MGLPEPYYSENNITLYCGNAIEIIPQLDYVNFILTDPPYGTGKMCGGYGRAQNHGGRGRTITNDDNLDVLKASAKLLYLAVMHCGWFITFCAPRRMLEVGNIFSGVGFEPYGEIIWDKGAPGLGQTIRYGHESMLVFRKSENAIVDQPIMSMQRESVDRVATQLRHPHEKPVKILKSVLMLSSGTVLDPFCGAGSTLRAAKDLGRKCIGIEIEERWCEHAVKLLKQETLDWTIK